MLFVMEIIISKFIIYKKMFKHLLFNKNTGLRGLTTPASQLLKPTPLMTPYFNMMTLNAAGQRFAGALRL